MDLFSNTSLKIGRPHRLVSIDLFNYAEEQPQPLTYSTLDDCYENCPELMAVINTLVTDIMSDGYDVIPLEKDNEDDFMKKKCNRMEVYLQRIKFWKKLRTHLIQAFLTGDGYFEHQEMTKKELNNLVEKVYKKFCPFKMKSTEIKKNVSKFVDKFMAMGIMPFNIWNIRSSSMKIKVDDRGNIKSYIQRIGLNKEEFQPRNIYHWQPINLCGPYGFAPSHALPDDMATLMYAKQYAGKFFQNGGIPNWIFNLPKARGIEDRNYQVLKQELKEFRKRKNFHKHLVITGEFDAKKLNDFGKDLEFESLINLETQRIAMAYGVPPSRMPYTMGRKGEFREYTEGYWKNVNFYQTDIEIELTNKIFAKYGMKFQFRRQYKIDELREAQIVGILVDRGLISRKEARKMMGKLTAEPDGEMAPTAPKRDLPQRDLGDKQDARGLAQDVGARLA